MWMFKCLNPIHPVVNIVGFLQTVGRQLTAATTVGTSIRQKNAVMILHQPFAVAVGTEAVIRGTVQKNNCVAVPLLRAHEPGTQDRAVWSFKSYITEFNRVFLRSGRHIALLVGRNRMARSVQGDPAQANATKKGFCEVEISR